MNILVLEKYKNYLAHRYSTFSYVFNKLSNREPNLIVELGTTRSFVNGNVPGCTSSNLIYWDENKIDDWDWGAGIFTRICAEIIAGTENILHTVDPLEKALFISKTMTSGIDSKIYFHPTTSTYFLKGFKGKIDLLYMDHQETSEAGAQLHLQDAQVLLELDLLAKNAIILIDDVHTGSPLYFDYGKGKYSIPFFKEKGFKITLEEYQVVMERLI